jgi:hypothetical protein
VPQRRFPPLRVPTLQIAHIHGSHRALRQSKPSRHLPRRSRFTCFAYCFLEPLGKRRLARQLRHPLNSQAAIRAAHAMKLHHHRGAVLTPRKIPHFPCGRVLDGSAMLSAPRADQLLGASLPPHPQLQPFLPLVHLMLEDLISRPSQNLCPILVSQAPPVYPIRLVGRNYIPPRDLSDSCSEPHY